MKYATIALTCTLGFWPVFGCKQSEPTNVDPHIAETVAPINVALANSANTRTDHLRPASSRADTLSTSDVTTVRNVLAPNPVTVGASLGRTFQGEIVADVRLPNKAKPASLRYMASGARMRMRLDGSSKDFDLIADGKTLAVLNHAKHSFRKFDLTELSTTPQQEDTSVDRQGDLKQTENADTETFQAGVRCEEHTIKGPHTEIHACVAGLPGAFERGVFERATGLLMPSWLATLVDNEEIPLRVQGHSGNSGEFTATVTRYSPDPVPEDTFIVPANYVQQTM